MAAERLRRQEIATTPSARLGSNNDGAPLRILFCAPNYYPAPAGGAERQARLQAEELARRGHRVTVICPRMGGLASGDIEGVHVRRLPRIARRPFSRPSYLVSLLAYLLLRLRAFDLVHVHIAALHADVAALVAAALRRPLYVKLACGGEQGEVTRMRRVARITRYVGILRADLVQALTSEIETELTSIGVAPERIRLIPNGLDLSTFTPADSDAKVRARRELGLPRDGVIVLFAGRFAVYKGVLDLLEAWRRLSPQGARLVLVGSHYTDHPVGSLPSPPGSEEREWTNDMLGYLRAVDVLVAPSHADGMSNSLLEAMACGLAVVATRVASTESFIADGSSGLLVDPRRPDQLALALGRLVESPELRERLGRNAAEAVQAYSIQNIVGRIESAYRELVPAHFETKS